MRMYVAVRNPYIPLEIRAARHSGPFIIGGDGAPKVSRDALTKMLGVESDSHGSSGSCKARVDYAAKLSESAPAGTRSQGH